MPRRTWFMLLATALASGYAGGYFLFRDVRVHAQTGPAALTIDLRQGRVPARLLSKGWSQPDTTGAWAKGLDAELLIELAQAPTSDLELVLDVLAKPASPTEQTLFYVPVTVNGAANGAMAVVPTQPESRQRVIVSKAASAGQKQLRIGFKLEALTGAGGPIVAFGLRSASLRDISSLNGFQGSVDGCIPGGLVGWAIASDGPAPVRVKVDGRVVPSTSTTVVRPELAPLSLPQDSGFAVRFADALPRGASVDVLFPNGERLVNSPCKVG